MPRISRFLFGSWLKQKDTYHDFSDGIMQSGYINYKNFVSPQVCKEDR